ncbi:MAG: hypothetical protein IH964_13140 [Candidatus Dadabacteria bacterium]|nr:hypothetical protein [Candidatus Dadabacteria bacterium]
MKKLLLASALAVGLSFPAISKAEVSAFGVNLSVGQSEVSENIRGGYIAQDHNDTLEIQKLHNQSESKSFNSIDSKNVTLVVFGVTLDGTKVI